MSHRVLVTGADGLIGRQVVPLLGALGHHVIALDYRGATASAHESIQCDLLNPDSRKGAVQQARASHLLHLAWHDSPKERWSSPINRQWSEATLELLRDFGASGGHRAVCVGSCAEYDWSQAVLSEQTPLKPRSLYGEAKANAYRSCHAEASALGVSLAWARIFFCYGPGEPQGRLLGDLLMGLSQGKPVACTDGEQERDFLYTRDVAKALVETLFSTLEGPVNVGSGKATPVRELIECAARLLQHPELIEWGAIKRGTDDPPRLVADITRLKSIGFRPDVGLEQGIKECIAALRSSSQE